MKQLLALAAILFSGAEIILKSGLWPRKSFFKGFSIFSFGGQFVQRSGTILAILVESLPRKLFRNRVIDLGGDVV